MNALSEVSTNNLQSMNQPLRRSNNEQEVLALVPAKMLPLEDHEILVKVEAMLQDPSDWKCTRFAVVSYRKERN